MTDLLWGAVALLALAGWAFTLSVFTKALLPMANAMKVLAHVDAFIDDKVRAVVSGVVRRSQRGESPKPNQDRKRNEEAGATPDILSNIFGGAPLEFVGEQPDSDAVEIVE